MEFVAGDFIFLSISPTRGTIRFGRRGKLSPRYIWPFEILDKLGAVTHRLALPPNLKGVHNIFYVFQLRRYIADPSHVLDHSELKVGPNLTYSEQPVEILDRREKQLSHQTISLVWVAWKHHSLGESTWEREDEMKEKYPYLLEP